MKTVNEHIRSLPDDIREMVLGSNCKIDNTLEPNPISAVWGCCILSRELHRRLEEIIPFGSQYEHVFLSTEPVPERYIWQYPYQLPASQ